MSFCHELCFSEVGSLVRCHVCVHGLCFHRPEEGVM